MNTGVAMAAFVRARLDEEQAAAQDAGACGGWRMSERFPGMVGTGPEPEPGQRDNTQWVLPLKHEWAEHIARHDPTRVLRDVAMKRRILARHDDQHDCGDPRSWDYPYEGCADLRALAAMNDDHPDYQEAWRS